jgi:uncharacterized protein YdaU (DUF1376 family)
MGGTVSAVGIWMPLFIKDHRARVGTLTHVQHSALVYLHMLLWENGGSIADDDKLIAAELRLTNKQWLEMRARLLLDCTLSGGKISHPKIIAELSKAEANRDQKRRAGRASAEARKANARSTDVATHVQPRAGGGVGVGIYHQTQEEESLGSSRTRDGLTVIGGGVK